MNGIRIGTQTQKTRIYRTDRVRYGGGGQRRRRRQSVAVPFSRRQGRRRALHPDLPDPHFYVRVHSFDIGYRSGTEDRKEFHQCIRRHEPEVEIPRDPDFPCPRAHHDLLRRHRRMDHEVHRSVSHRTGRSRRNGLLFHGLHHVARPVRVLRDRVHAAHGVDRI